MAVKIQRPKGTQDVLPSGVHIWQYTEQLLRETGRLFGFEEIRFPSFEHTELFERGVGDTTDVVQKEMYTFIDKGGRSITLRPEGTASTVRAYIENGEASRGTPYKAYYIAPVFRYEKPQAGRLREHHQFGVELFGAPAPSADAEVIALARYYLERLHINVELHLNSIGCPKCRPEYNKALKEFLGERRDELCETCKDRLERNPLRVLDCKEEKCRAITDGAPRNIDHLCPECAEHFEKLRKILDTIGIKYVIDPKLVRGLDYYTRTVFEFISTDIGAQGTVLGGGRYDGLIAQLGGQATPAVGFGCGIERLISAAQASGMVFPEADKCAVYLISADAEGAGLCVSLAASLRAAGIRAETDLCDRGVRAQLKHADRIGARFTAVCGASEAETGIIKLKNMKTGETFEIPVSEIQKTIEEQI